MTNENDIQRGQTDITDKMTHALQSIVFNNSNLLQITN